MEMNKLLSIVDGLHTPVTECTQLQPSTFSAPAPEMVNMSLNLNAQGIEQIKNLIGLINKHEDTEVIQTQPHPPTVATDHQSEPSNDVTTISKLAGIEIEPDAKTETSEFRANTTPEEEYYDINYMTNDLAGGMNGPKKQFKHSYKQGDNPMAEDVVQLKNNLLAEFEQFKNK